MIVFNITVQNTTVNSSVFDTDGDANSDIQSPRHHVGHPKLIHLYLFEYLVSVVGSVFNLIALFFILLTPDLRIEKSNIFITSLILANILITIKLGLLQNQLKNIHAYDNNCLYGNLLTIFTVSASCFSRSLIAIDRYNYICYPLHYQSKTTNVYVASMLLLQWLTSSALTGTAYMFFSDRELTERHTDVICMPFSTSLSGMIILAVVIIVSSLIITYVYCMIFYWAYIQIRLMKQETFLRATQRSSTITIQEYFKSAWRIRRITRATDLLAPLESKQSAGSFTLILDKTALREHERNRTLSSYLSTSFSFVMNKFHRRMAMTQSTLLTRGTSVDDATRSPPMLGELPNALLTEAAAEPSGQAEPDESEDEYGEAEENEAPKKEAVETIPVDALKEELLSASMINDELKDKWYEHEMKRYTGSMLANFFFPTADRRISIGSVMMIDKLRKREIKALTVVIITFGAHLICWLPYLLYSGCSLYWSIYLTSSQEGLILLVGFTCCIFDPIVYCLLNQPFRHTTVAHCRHCWNSLEM